MWEPPVSLAFIYKMAREIVYDENVIDDCVQEGFIQLWRVQRADPSRSLSYLKRCIKRRIIEVSTRGTWLGGPWKHGHPTDPLRLPHESLSYGEPAQEAVIQRIG